jgi:hypothetical protein
VGNRGFSTVPHLSIRDLEQGGNTNIVVRRDPTTGGIPVLSPTAGAAPDGPRGRPCMRSQMLEGWARFRGMMQIAEPWYPRHCQTSPIW